MRKLIFSFVCAAAICIAASPFDGRWDITITGSHSTAWWLELKGVGTPDAAGTFISDYWGDLNKIDEFAQAKLSDGADELTITFRHKQEGKEIVNRYTMRLVDGKLTGEAHKQGREKPIAFIGVRAPEIAETDDATWKPGEPVALFNHKDTTGWRSLTPEKVFGWTVEDGILKSTGGGSNLISEAKFWNYELHVELRLAPQSNSGLGLRARYEVQVLEDYGQKQNSHNNGALYSRIAPSENASRRAGEWQTYDVRLVGRTVTVVLNGKKVIDKGHIDGLTAIASDPNEGEPGALILQGDHGPVDFREIVITPLKK